MNHPESTNSPDERELDEFWDCLKQIEPPLETRIASRDAVASELAQASKRRRRQGVPFWWRTMEIPWPVVAATIAILVGLSASHIRLNAVSNEGTHQDYASVEDALESPVRETASDPDTKRPASRQSMTYLCGIGTLRTETKYFPEELE